MVTVRRKKSSPSFRRNPLIAGLSLAILVISLVTLINIDLATEKLTMKELVQKEEAFIEGTVNQLRHRRSNKVSGKGPMKVDDVIDFLYEWVHRLHNALMKQENLVSANAMWATYHNLTRDLVVPWDAEYISRLDPPRQDDSIFLSVATYRDENCPNTLSWAFGNATFPERLFVGLVQQNCYEDCVSGIMEGGGTRKIPPDDDCHTIFCDSHPQYCSHIRPIKLKEIESLGPYGARFLASKLYSGEQWFMQIDAHMTFLQHWDDITVRSLHAAPSDKPLLSHYPPGHLMDLAHHWALRPAGRLCGPVFSKPDGGMLRLEGLRKWDKIKIPIPRFSPFAAAGFFMGTALFLKEVPFDPFLPWIFMGEEIIMSTRFWTSGYDLFSPAQAVVGHIYVRQHKPKFWETMHRYFRKAGQDDLEMMILLRIKHQLGYPEASRDLITVPTLLDDLDRYSMGTARTLEDYMNYAGIDVQRKEVWNSHYCEEHWMPPGKEHLAKLYEDAEALASMNATLVEAGK